MTLTVHMFSTSTCAHCKPVKAALEELAAEYSDLVLSYTVVDKDTNGMALAAEWEINSVPTLIFIKDVEEKSRQVGAVNKETLRRYVDGFIQRDLLQEPSRGSDERSGSVLCGISRQEN